MSFVPNLNNTNPAAPAGNVDIAWQKGAISTGTDTNTGLPIYPVSAYVPSTGGVAAKTANYTAVAADCGKLLSFNSASAVTLTLPATAPFAAWNIAIENIGAGALTVSPGTLTLDGSSSALTLSQNQGCYVATDGTNYFSSRGVGGGAGASIYFGEGEATASSSYNKITFGSTPLAGSVKVFSNSSLLSPSTYTISGAVLTLNSGSFTSGADLVAFWATSNSTPGGITLSGSYSPVSGMTVWFQADAISATDGQTITSWADSSGNGNTATVVNGTATYHTNQINGKPAITFASCGMTLATAVAATAGHTAFVVIKNTGTPSTSRGAILGGASNGFAYWTGNTTQQGADAQGNTQLGTGTAAANTNWNQMNVVAQNQIPSFFCNFRLNRAADATLASTGTNVTGNGPTTIGKPGDGEVQWFAGQIAEIIYYNQVLTSTQITQVETYLNAKYGL